MKSKGGQYIEITPQLISLEDLFQQYECPYESINSIEGDNLLQYYLSPGLLNNKQFIKELTQRIEKITEDNKTIAKLDELIKAGDERLASLAQGKPSFFPAQGAEGGTPNKPQGRAKHTADKPSGPSKG